MTTPTYVIRGGLQGRERLRIIARVMWPTTYDLLARVGVADTARCLDLGCGGGDVAAELARIAVAGSVVGTDLDEAKLEIARAEAAEARLGNLEFRTADATLPDASDGDYDLVYVRFLLTHLTDPAGAIEHAVDRLAPGGALVVEDIDFTGHFCHPDSPAFWSYVDWYTRVVQARGADPNIGPRLPGLLADAGLERVGMNVVQPVGTTGEVKLISPITLEAIADAVLAAGLATPEQLAQTVDDLYEFAGSDGTVLSVPRIVQAWGWRSERIDLLRVHDEASLMHREPAGAPRRRASGGSTGPPRDRDSP